MKKQIIRLTEQDLHNIIKESVNQILKEEVIYDLKPYEDLKKYLENHGVPGIEIWDYNNNGMICLRLSTRIYDEYDVMTIANKFAKARGMYATDRWYPATTYIILEKF
jgi:hypothetical protein